MCRCWKSAKFPRCDGAHNQHNKDTGDNVGPLIVKFVK
jgi:CDGSH-type Zn-finger protein